RNIPLQKYTTLSAGSLSRRSLRVFPSLSTALIARFHYYDGCLERRTVDSCGNSTCLKTPQSGFLEEAEAVPAESNGPQRKTHALTSRLIFCANNNNSLRSGE